MKNLFTARFFSFYSPFLLLLPVHACFLLLISSATFPAPATEDSMECQFETRAQQVARELEALERKMSEPEPPLDVEMFFQVLAGAYRERRDRETMKTFFQKRKKNWDVSYLVIKAKTIKLIDREKRAPLTLKLLQEKKNSLHVKKLRLENEEIRGLVKILERLRRGSPAEPVAGRFIVNRVGTGEIELTLVELERTVRE